MSGNAPAGGEAKPPPSPRFQMPTVLGAHPSSQRPSAPSYSFGCSSREAQDKVFLSHKHEQLKPSLESPGPIYKLPTMTGHGPKHSFGTSPQRVEIRAQYPDSSVDLIEGNLDSQTIKFETPKTFLFGTEAKDCNKNALILRHHPQANYGLISPGPVAYQPNKEVVERTPEAYTIASKTPVLGSQPQTPGKVGPGKYYIEKVADSRWKGVPSWGFSKQKRFPETEMDRSILSVCPPLNAMGKQVNSRKASSPRYGFGTATRDKKAKTFLVQVPADKGPASAFGKVRLPHPPLPMEKELVKWSPRGIGHQGMN